MPRGASSEISILGACLCSELFGDLVDSVLDGCDGAGLFIGNLDSEYFLKFHEELDSVERICTEVVGEVGGLRHFGRLYAELVDDDALYLTYDLTYIKVNGS